MPKKQSWYEENVQPLNWHRAFFSGVCASLMMMAWVDTFYMTQVTPFCFETYLGNLILHRNYGPNIWTVGFFANMAMGGVFGLFYAYFFEFVYTRAGARNGVIVGFYHSILAAVAVFPFFKLVEDAASETVANVALYKDFGFFGSALGAATPLILFFAHLIFGATMGTFYGPVRMDRVRSLYIEPEDTVYEEEVLSGDKAA